MPSQLQGGVQELSRLTLPTKPYWLSGLARAGYTSLLERLVAGTSDERLQDALELVVRTVEAQDEGVTASILLLNRETGQLQHVAGQRLPRRYRELIDGETIGPEKGSCGSAAYLKTRVIVTDIATDPRWRDYREFALEAGFAACWSQPILDDTGVLGTFAMYYAEPRAPTSDALLLIDAAAHLARLAIERSQARTVAIDRTKLQDRLWHAQKLESLGMLAGGVAHDFGNLLVAVLGSADLIERKLSENSPLLEDVHRIQSAGLRCADLCRQLLAYAGKGKIVLTAFRVDELIREMGHLIEVSLPKGLKLRHYFADDVPPIEADPSQLRQVVLNLLTNAAEAITHEGGVISISVDVVDADESFLKSAFAGESLPAGRYVTLEVSDNGSGMDADTVKRIFDPFFTTKLAGRGLGLAAVLGVVRSHGGALRVCSEPGQGSLFKVLLPASRKEAIAVSPSRAPPVKFEGQGTVLVVDDEEGVRIVAKGMLEMHGFDVLLAKDGEEALALFREQHDKVVAVLLDLILPRMDGQAVLRELRRIDRAVPVILSSGYGEQDMDERFDKGEVFAFVQKPFRYETFIELIRRAVDTNKERAHAH